MTREVNGRMFIEIEFPCPIDDLGALLKVAGQRWPKATIDLHHPGGWKLELKPEHQKGYRHDNHGATPERPDSG
jgi:hypothetical protein